MTDEPTSSRPTERWVGWCVGLGLALLALFLRVWRLGTPHRFEFDETYYAKDAWSLLHHGYVRNYVENADKMILSGQTHDLWADGPSMVVHPEVAKWLIAMGEWALGMDPTGWRIASAVTGSLMVLVLFRLVLRITGSLLLASIGALLLCFDGLHFVLSRLALIDLFLAFFMLVAVHCMVADRQWIRRRLVEPVSSGWGPVVLWRPWLLCAGLAFGLAVGTKWNALYVIAAMGLLFWAWSTGARKRIGVRRPWLPAAVLDAAPALVYLLAVPLVVYVLTWTGWLMHAHEYELALSDTQYGPYWGSYIETDASGFLGEAWQSLRSLWHYHHDVYSFHTGFLNEATHPYASNPLGWPILNRPVAVDASLDIQPGQQGCGAAEGSTCLRVVTLLGTPALWWVAVPAMLWALASWVLRRDWRYGVAVVGYLATWLPWFQYSDRPIFSYYAVAMLPFMVLGVTLVLGEIIGSADAPRRRRVIGAVVAGAVVVAVVLNFAWFWPIYTDGLLTNAEWMQRVWFDRWI